MGQYLIPNARSGVEALDYSPGGQAVVVAGGVLVTDATRTDAALAAAYAGFVPSGLDDNAYEPVMSAAIRLHAGHLRDYEAAIRAGQAVTSAQTTHVIADIIAYIRLTEPRL